MIDRKTLLELTNIQLTSKLTEPKSESLTLDGMTVPLYRTQALVAGTGAAGLRSAIEISGRGIDVIAATSMLFAGTSACSGSDKQTLFSCSTSRHGDDVLEAAESICAGGAMDKDLAYIEAAGSYLAMDGLRSFGLPLPCDRYGAVLRYQTDHDDAGRATSCGPRTSRLMVKVLSEEAARRAVTLLDGASVIDLIQDEDKCCGAILCGRRFAADKNPYGLAVILAEAVVLAGGGAGMLYRDSVYPYGCCGTTGVGLLCGLKASNLQEMQFGIGTDKKTFAWNLSGTYMQVIPDVYSKDPKDPNSKRHFLKDYYRSTAEICSNIFRKGYQWPIHAMRMLDFKSSLFDLAVYAEKQAGRQVFLDFTHEYQGPDDDPFCLEDLDEDIISYLSAANALISNPLERLRKMNPLAIELYSSQGIDIEHQPLEFNVNHQHFNGGLSVDERAETSLKGVFAIGETAGTHGVTRPGGAALNSGQVFALRAAERIAFRIKHDSSSSETAALKAAQEALKRCQDFALKSRRSDALPLGKIRELLPSLMSNDFGFICSPDKVDEGLRITTELFQEVESLGIACQPEEIASAFEWRALACEACAIAASLSFYIARGGGSRGARVILSRAPDALKPQASALDLSAYSFKPENLKLRDEIVEVRIVSGAPKASARQVNDWPEVYGIFFEKNWPDFLNGLIFENKE